MKRKPEHDNVLIERLTIMLTIFWVIPIAFMRMDIMESTGYSRDNNPILFGLIYDYHTHICLLWACALILAMSLSIKKGAASY
jgi:hypothetical protein